MRIAHALYSAAVLGAALTLGCKPTRATAPTHYVAATGAGDGPCSKAQPCNLWRAASIVGTSALPAGSWVDVAPGYYSQSQLTFTGNGTAAAPIRFVFHEGAIVTATREKPSAWALTAGYRYVYETVWRDETWAVGTVAQRQPASWRPILVDESAYLRPFTLTLPPTYKACYSLACVEAQSGTFYADGAADRVYVHTYTDTAPTAADDLYLAPKDWGSLVIDSDHVWFENLTIEKTSGTAILVRNKSDGARFLGLHANNAQVWLQGWNLVAEDIDVSHVIRQGDPANDQCFDSNADFGVGECWNAYADGRALLIGKEGAEGSYQTVRRASVTRSWNGLRIDGRNTLDGCLVWGMPNHAIEASGSDFVIRNCQVLNTQDALFMKSNPADRFTVEQNLFIGSAYVTTSNDGSGGTPVTAWTYRRNAHTAFVVDRHAYEGLTSDCNAYVAEDRLFRILDTNGIPGDTYHTLDAVRAATPFEDQSVWYPSTFWAQGLAFVKFTKPAEAFDLRDPLSACGARIGPTAFYPPPPFIP